MNTQQTISSYCPLIQWTSDLESAAIRDEHEWIADMNALCSMQAEARRSAAVVAWLVGAGILAVLFACLLLLIGAR